MINNILEIRVGVPALISFRRRGGSDMNKQQIEQLWGEIAPSIETLGYEIVDIEFIREHGDNILRFFIYNEQGTTIEDCEKASAVISDELDRLDPIKNAYLLEVSSPDLNRALKSDIDLERNIGILVNCHFYRAHDGQKIVTGTLESYNEEEISLNLDGNTKSFLRKDIAKIKIAIVF